MFCVWGCSRPPAQAERAEPPVTAKSADDRPVVLCVGTSLTAGYGLDPDQAYCELLQA